MAYWARRVAVRGRSGRGGRQRGVAWRGDAGSRWRALRRDRRHCRDLSALGRGLNGGSRCGRGGVLAHEEGVQRPFHGAEGCFAGKEGSKGLAAQHRLHGSELLGLIAHPHAIAACDRVLAGAQQHSIGDPWLRGRMLLELLLDRLQPVVELLGLRVQPDKFGDQRGDLGVAQGGCGGVSDRSGQACQAPGRTIPQHRLVLGDQAATARAGVIKLRRALRT